MLGNLLSRDPAEIIAILAALVVSISVHEFAHALAGYLQGDMTARDEGRLTLNPLAHLDPMGSVMLLLVGFGWGKPTPYNPYNLRNARYGPLIVALFGPLSNFLTAAGSLAVLGVLSQWLPVQNMLMLFLAYLAVVNVILMVFNLIPIPPLDGSQILFTLLPYRFRAFKLLFAHYGPMILMGLLVIDAFTNIGFFGFIYQFIISVLSRFLP